MNSTMIQASYLDCSGRGSGDAADAPPRPQSRPLAEACGFAGAPTGRVCPTTMRYDRISASTDSNRIRTAAGLIVRGGSSWTEPTVFAMLAGYACGDDTRPGAARSTGCAKCSGRRRMVSQARSRRKHLGHGSGRAASAGRPGRSAPHARHPLADGDDRPPIATMYPGCRRGSAATPPPNPIAGWPWLPGTAAWATRPPSPFWRWPKRIAAILTRCCGAGSKAHAIFCSPHRCPDGGWNHGSARALGVDAPSYPETTGTALLAVAACDRRRSIAPSIRCAEKWWNRLSVLRGGKLADAGTAGRRPRRNRVRRRRCPATDHPRCRTAARSPRPETRGLEVFIA